MRSHVLRRPWFLALGLAQLLAGVAAGGCRGGSASSPTSGSAAPPTVDVAPRRADPEPPAPVAAPTPAPVTAPVPDPAAPVPAPTATAAATGVNFIEDAKLLFRVAACGSTEQPIPDPLTGGDAKTAAKLTTIVDAHCKRILEQIGSYRSAYFEKHRRWFDSVIPRDVPTTVVYPFGGGDLLSALVAFPAATEITTISLEQAGDPRRLRTLKPAAIQASLGALRIEIGGLISVSSNTSENLSGGQRNELPGQVSSFLLGLVAGGFEPVAMRYFTLDDSGAVDYLDQTEIDALDAKRPRSLKHDWQSPNFSEAFAHVEIQYKKPGETTVRVHRHIGWNLGDDYLAKNAQLLRHLESKGKVTMLTKGASYLLWRGDFSKIRGYILSHLAWMLSDSTGVPPMYAKKAGMVQVTYGTYTGAFLEGAQNSNTDASFIELWSKNPKRRLPFRFGYVDRDKQAHLVVTRPRS